ncbi:MAG: hypothetical protein RR346_12255, partial [Bacteroidales bacterium]
MKKFIPLLSACCLCIGIFDSCKNKTSQPETKLEKEIKTEISTPPPVNKYLAAGNYSVSHFNPALTNSFPEKIKNGNYQVYAGILQDVIPAMLSGMTLNSTSDSYFWISGANEIYYISASEGRFLPMARFSLSAIDDEQKLKAALATYAGKNYTTGDSLKMASKTLFGQLNQQPLPDNLLSLVDCDNTLFTIYNRKLLAVKLTDSTNPAKGIEVSRQLNIDGLITKEDSPVGLQMLYDGNLILNSKQGHFCIISRDSLLLKNQLQIVPVQQFFGPVAIDDKNGIYAVSDSMVMKLVWNGTHLSLSEKDGAWNSPITYDRDSLLLQKGGGMLGSPTLMGFGNDPDKLVIVADGAKRANLIAFWRDEIPTDSITKKDRVAGKITVNCGIYSGNDNNFLQSYHSLPVYGYGTFFVNTINGYPTPKTCEDFALLGSIIPCPKGIERFEWDYKNNRWLSIWSEPTVASSGMKPVISTGSKLVLLNSFDSTNAVVGWNIKGFDWITGNLQNQIIFSSNTQYGNGMNGYFQFLKDGDMIFNSIGGVYRIAFGDDRGINKAPRL